MENEIFLIFPYKGRKVQSDKLLFGNSLLYVILSVTLHKMKAGLMPAQSNNHGQVQGGVGNTNTVKTNRDTSIVKIAVRYGVRHSNSNIQGQGDDQVEGGDKVPQLKELNQRQPLNTLITELCHLWGLNNPQDYALHYSDHTNYVTEKNRNEIKNGSVLNLELSPARAVEQVLVGIDSKVDADELEALKNLARLSPDITFALEFITKKGVSALTTRIEENTFRGESLAFALVSFAELMEHGVVSWDTLEPKFVSSVAALLGGGSPKAEVGVLRPCLSVLENVALNSSGRAAQLDRELTVPALVTLLQSSEDQVTRQNVIALINALLMKAETTRRRAMCATLCSEQVRKIIRASVVQAPGLGAEMAHQLYVLQSLLLCLVEQRTIPVDPDDSEVIDKAKELQRIAFESEPEGGARRSDRRHLGFETDPLSDLSAEGVPGALALDCMIYFARNYPESYAKIVLENNCRPDEQECPFGRTAIELVRLCCDILRIGEPPTDQGQTYHPILFAHNRPFEEFFCASIVLLNKTWKEMRATTEDFVKVFSVVREQIQRALAGLPMTFDKYRQKTMQLTYSEITQIWQQERTNREEWESHARPIVELKEQITPEILELIKKQRLGILANGTRFTKYSTRGQRIKDKFWFVRLSPNQKVLHYGDCDEKCNPSVDELSNKLPVADIKGLVVGKECPHMKDAKGRKTAHQLAFSITIDSVEMTSLDFVAQDEQVFDYWTDGLNALLGNKMSSASCKNDLETLLSMDIKLRLLDAEGIDIPQEPPPIPPEPDNYDFYYDKK